MSPMDTRPTQPSLHVMMARAADHILRLIAAGVESPRLTIYPDGSGHVNLGRANDLTGVQAQLACELFHSQREVSTAGTPAHPDFEIEFCQGLWVD